MAQTANARAAADLPSIRVADDIRRPMLVGLTAFLLFFGGLGAGRQHFNWTER